MPRLWSSIILLVACAANCASGREAADLFHDATVKMRIFDFPAALEVTEQALESLASRPDSEWPWKFRLLQAEIHLDDRSNVQAADLLGQIEKSLPANRFPGLKARLLMLRGRLAEAPSEKSQNYQLAYRKAEALGDWNLLSEIERLQARLLWDEAEELESQNRFAARSEKIEQAIGLLQRVSGRPADEIEAFHAARAYVNLGYSNQLLSRWAEARDWAKKALLHSEQAGIPWLRVLSHLNFGTYGNQLGRFDEARQHLEEVQQEAGPFFRHDVLRELGNNDLFQRNWPNAVFNYAEAAKAAGEAGLKEKRIEYLKNQAIAWTEANDCVQASLKRQLVAAELEKAGTPESSSLLPDLINQARFEEVCGEAEAAKSLYEKVRQEAQDSPQLLWKAHLGLGILHSKQKRWEEAVKQFEAALEIIDSTDKELLYREDRMAHFSRLIGLYKRYVYTLVESGRTDRALEVSDASRARILEDEIGAAARQGRAQDFQQAARSSGRLFLSYWISELGCYLWVVTGDGIEFIELDADKDSLAALVRSFEKELDDLGTLQELAQEGGSQLFKVLVEPALPFLPPKPRLVLALDESLHRINFETLPAGGQERPSCWFQEGAVISIAPSLGLISASPVMAGLKLDSALLVGSPVFADPDYPPLDYAEKEIQKFQEILAAKADLKDFVQLVRQDANPEKLRELDLGLFSFLYFATHAEANAGSPLDSSIILSESGGSSKLYAREILKRDLTAQLVILSACDTVGKRVFSGEGPVGLAWAFLGGGSANVIASQWPATDRTTSQLMESFIRQLVEDEIAPDLALHRAKMEHLRDNPSSKPYYWAPFQLYARQLTR